jgi:hypothetical protein
MGAPDLLHTLRDQGFKLWTEGGRVMVAPKERITDEMRALIREHKAELLTALAVEPLPDRGAEARRTRVLEMLAENPTARYAALTDLDAVPGVVVLTFVLRGEVTFDLYVPASKWDGVLFLDLLERHSGTVH